MYTIRTYPIRVFTGSKGGLVLALPWIFYFAPVFRTAAEICSRVSAKIYWPPYKTRKKRREVGLTFPTSAKRSQFLLVLQKNVRKEYFHRSLFWNDHFFSKLVGQKAPTEGFQLLFWAIFFLQFWRVWPLDILRQVLTCNRQRPFKKKW